MTSLRFLQFSDLHVGRSLEGSQLQLTDEQRKTLRSERLDCLERIVDVAIEEGVEVVFVPGDLFEEDRVRKEEVRRMRRAFETLQSIPVVITPGNHDYDSRLSWYHQDVMRKHQLEPWPENVHIFSGFPFDCMRVPEVDSLRITGFAYQSNRRLSEWPGGADVTGEQGLIDVLMIHGSLSSVLPPGKMNTLPVTEEQIRDHPSDYVAMGHYHDAYTVEDGTYVRGAYAGSPMPVTVGDTGERKVLLGELTEEGVPRESMDARSVCSRRLMDVSIEGNADEGPAGFQRRVQGKFEEEGVREEDLVKLQLSGEHPGKEVLDRDELQSYFDSYFHVELDVRRTAPPLEPDAYREESTEQGGTTEKQFVRQMMERMGEASSEERREILSNALRMGLSAFRREEVELSDVL